MACAITRLVCTWSVAAAATDAWNKDVALAMSTDDTCTEQTDGTDGRSNCAINALQLRSGKAQGVTARGEKQEHPVLNLDLFSLRKKEDVNEELSNVDMLSLVGVMRYLHTHVVWEHEGDWTGTADPRMETRAKDFDVIVGVNAKVRNPDSVIENVGDIDNYVDFGVLAEFVDGMATGPSYNWDFGDIVGVARIRDHAYASFHPYYEFSLSGFCPNLQFKQKHEEQTEETGFCMTYADRYDQPAGKVLRGGLCPNGTKLGALPTGQPGCSYTYTPPTKEDIVSLDDLVGITNQSCGDGRLCKDWQDWRMHCTDKRYKVKFNYMDRHHRVLAHRAHHASHHRRRALLTQTDMLSADLVRTNVCVEYDIHKACAKDCNSLACKKVPAHLREVGLPFWKGRCNPLRNAQRAEQLAQALGLSDATETHDLVRFEQSVSPQTCLTSDPDALCRPDPISGGEYCSRAWAGVCQPCFIPNTVEPYPNNASTPVCPWNILKVGNDYADASLHPKCATDVPRDLCCLYSDTCNSELIGSAMAIGENATEDGFAYAASLQNTEAMMAFLWRAAKQQLDIDVFSLDGASEVAYWSWGNAPLPGLTLEQVLEELKFKAK